MTLTIILILLLSLLLLGIPVAFALLLSGSIGIFLIGSESMLTASLNSLPYSALTNYELITIPLFLLMAELMVVSGIAQSMFHAIAVWLNGIKGGLGAATALTGAAFGALSGSSVASSATLAAVAVPSMRAHGYDSELAAGVAATSGGLAMLIPPSIVIIIFGILTETDISKLLIAGIIPGILLTLMIISVIIINGHIKPTSIPQKENKPDWQARINSLKSIWSFTLLFALVTGSIYTGVATPVEASGLGAFGALLLSLVNKKLTSKSFFEAIRKTMLTTAMIAFILVGASVFGLFITLTGITKDLLYIIGSSNTSPLLIILLISITYLALGLFLDTITILVLTLPIVQPIIGTLGYDMVWFGIIAVLLVETGLITPPLGLNVFIVAKVSKMKVTNVFRGVMPFVIGQLAIILLLIFIPEIITWLPTRMD